MRRVEFWFEVVVRRADRLFAALRLCGNNKESRISGSLTCSPGWT